MKILDFFSKYQLFIIFSCIVLLVFSFMDKLLVVGTISVLFLASVSLFSVGKFDKDNQKKILSALFLIIFSLHIFIIIFVYYTHFQPLSGGSGDYIFYNQDAQVISARLHQGNFSAKGLMIGNYYSVIIGYVYALTVSNMFMGELFNAWLVAILVIFIYLIVREFGGSEKQGFLAGLIAGVYPSLAFYGSLLLKDALVVLLSMIGLWLTIKTIKNFSFWKFLGFFVILTSLIHFRFYVGYALMFTFIISWFLASNFKLKKRITYGIAMVVVLGFCPLLLNGGYYGFTNFKIFLNADRITYYREIVYAPPTQLKTVETKIISESGKKTSSIVIKTGLENPVTFVKNTMLSFACSLLGPFPWQLSLRKYLFIFPEMIAWYFILFFIAKGMVNLIREKNKNIIPLILFSCFVLGTLAIFMTNFGIITRIRMPAFLALLCLFPLGFKQLKYVKIPLLNNILNII